MTKIKTKRILKDFNFEENGSRLDLVFKTQGGAANSYHTALIMKATKDLDDNIINDYVENIENQNGEIPVDKIQVEKAQYEQLEKNANEKEVAVAKAAQLEADLASVQEELAVMKAAKEASELEIVKASLKDLVAAESIETVAKGLRAMDKESADAIIASLSAQKQTIEKSALFEEVSHAEEVDVEKAAKEAQAKKRQDYLDAEAAKPIL